MDDFCLGGFIRGVGGSVDDDEEGALKEHLLDYNGFAEMKKLGAMFCSRQYQLC